MRTALALAAVLWPILLGSAVWTRQSGPSALSAVTGLVYLAASKVCHQRPERSFLTHGVQWPVCGRCSGLYLAAPVGAIAALARGRRTNLRLLLAIAAVPTLITVGVEWLGILPVTSIARALAAVPLGAAIAFALVTLVEGERVKG